MRVLDSAKARIFHTEILATIFVTILFFIQPAEAKDIVLHIAATEELAITTPKFEDYNAYIRNNLPDYELLTIKVPTKYLGYLRSWKQKEAHARIVQEVQALKINPGDQIKMIVFFTHGGTDAESTTLAHFGEFNIEGPNKELREILDPIRPFVASDVRIVMNSCSTLCGAESDGA